VGVATRPLPDHRGLRTCTAFPPATWRPATGRVRCCGSSSEAHRSLPSCYGPWIPLTRTGRGQTLGWFPRTTHPRPGTADLTSAPVRTFLGYQIQSTSPTWPYAHGLILPGDRAARSDNLLARANPSGKVRPARQGPEWLGLLPWSPLASRLGLTGKLTVRGRARPPRANQGFPEPRWTRACGSGTSEATWDRNPGPGPSRGPQMSPKGRGAFDVTVGGSPVCWLGPAGSFSVIPLAPPPHPLAQLYDNPGRCRLDLARTRNPLCSTRQRPGAPPENYPYGELGQTHRDRRNLRRPSFLVRVKAGAQAAADPRRRPRRPPSAPPPHPRGS